MMSANTVRGLQISPEPTHSATAATDDAVG